MQWDLSLSNTSIGGNQLNLSTTAISLHNITTAFVSNLSLLLFDSPINLSLVRLLLCDRELFCSILFLFGYLLLHCWPKIVRQICLKKDHFCWNLRQDEATTESPDSPYTGSKYLFAKKVKSVSFFFKMFFHNFFPQLILFIWVVIQLVEFGFHLWIRQETHVLDEDQSARLFTGGFNIHSPIWAHLVQLLVLVSWTYLVYWRLWNFSSSHVWLTILWAKSRQPSSLRIFWSPFTGSSPLSIHLQVWSHSIFKFHYKPHHCHSILFVRIVFGPEARELDIRHHSWSSPSWPNTLKSTKLIWISTFTLSTLASLPASLFFLSGPILL